MNALLTRVDLRRVWMIAAAVLLTWVFVRSFAGGLLDLRVYLAGGEAWRNDVGLYRENFEGPLGLPFTYPPFAAVLFSGLAALPLPIAALLFTATGLLLFTAACHTAAQRSGTTVPWAGVGLAAVCLALEPLRGGADLGQINMILMGLVVLDCLLPRTPWPRGVLIGIAAAIKLTPAIFVLYFLSRKQFRPVLNAVGAFAACGAVGWALAPGDSRQFWFDAMLDPQRVGGLAYTANQSLRGLLFRLDAPETLWIVLCLTVLAVTVLVLPRLRDDLTAVVAVAAAGLLISPVSWSHHWVWIAPALLLLRGWTRMAVAAVFALAPHWLLPSAGDRELEWYWWQHVVGNTYVWLGLAFLVWCAVTARQASSSSAERVALPR